jgi:hypothetical protein
MGAFLALKPNALQKPAKLVFGMIVTSFTSCHHVRMKIGPYIGCAVLVMVFGSAIFGILIRRKLPESHLSDESKGVVTLSMGVVGTLTALVLSLLIATASGTFNTRNQEITLIAAKVIQLDRLLRRYGPETAILRVLLRRYTAMRFQDLFPQGSAKPVLQNSNTITLFEDLEDQLAAMEGHNAQQPLAGVAGSGTDGRPDGGTVAFSRAGGARNPSSGAVGGFILAVPAFHEFRPVRTP